MSPLLAVHFTGGNLDFLVFVVLLVFGVAYSYYTIAGSAINNHPHNGRNGVPGSNRPDGIHDFADRQAYAAQVRNTARAAREAARYGYDEPGR